MDLHAILADPPAAHVEEDGRRAAWESSPRLLEALDTFLEPGMRTLETGAGVSTALFAARGCEHTCVVPFTAEIDRISAWCEAHGIDAGRIDFHRGRSEEVLPALEQTRLDAVLIDGGHGFPTPFLDWWYAGRRVRAGGIVCIDDTHLWTGAVLRDFLREQPGWELAARLPMRAAVLRRTSAEDGDGDWTAQPFVRRRSWDGGARGVARRAIRAADLARRDGFGALRERARR